MSSLTDDVPDDNGLEEGDIIRNDANALADDSSPAPLSSEARAKAAKGPKPNKEKKAKSPSAADALIAIALQNAEVFHGPGKVAYATIGPKTLKVKSRPFKLWLAGLYHRHSLGKVANAEAVTTALATLEAHAIFDSPEQLVFVRLAEHAGAIYLNLADEAGTVIEIDADGWRECETPPVRFLATPNASTLPRPVRGGAIAELRDFVNCPENHAFALLLGWISACFRLHGPFPLLVLNGNQGSAKSTTARILKSLIDPERVRDRCAPRDVRDLAIWSGNSWLLCVDNLSGFPDWLSDAFCRLATGGGFGTRTLYENDEETVFDSKRPVILNGIEDFVTRGDLLERSIILRHPLIPDGNRRLESELWAAFEGAKPRLLGSILDRLAAGLKALPNVDKARLPRMADAAAFAVACESGMRERPRFLDAFRENQSDSLELTLADSIIVPGLLLLVEGAGSWKGTATVLFDAIKPAGDRLPHGWPRKPSALSGAINRIASALEKVHGIEVIHERDADIKRSRIIRLERRKAENLREVPSGPSTASECCPALEPVPDGSGRPGR